MNWGVNQIGQPRNALQNRLLRRETTPFILLILPNYPHQTLRNIVPARPALAPLVDRPIQRLPHILRRLNHLQPPRHRQRLRDRGRDEAGMCRQTMIISQRVDIMRQPMTDAIRGKADQISGEQCGKVGVCIGAVVADVRGGRE
jgi:hypothetical protein